jgi:rod shape-determining protein MreC
MAQLLARRAKRRRFWIGVFLVLVLVWNLPFRFSLQFRVGFVSLLEPVLERVSWLDRQVEHWMEPLRSQAELQQEIDRLQERMHLLAQVETELREQEQENLRLRELLGYSPPPNHEILVSRVIARDAHSWWRSLWIDHGSSLGVTPSAAVTAPAGLVGRVLEVAPSASQVLLLIDPTCRVSALIQRSRANGIVEGAWSVDGRSLCKMTFIDRNADLLVGDDVVTSGLGQVYPAGILIGKITEIIRPEHQLYLDAWIEPAVDFSNLAEIMVLLP